MAVAKLRGMLFVLLSVFSLILGTQHFAGSAPPRTQNVEPQDVDRGELLRTGGSSYPRLIRLAHNGLANGRVLSSMTTYVDDTGFAVIYQSTDDGKTFQPLGEIHDPAGENKKGMCCSTLYELPAKIGDMPAGTLLWAGTAGIGDDEQTRQSSIRLWKSNDQGKTWQFASTPITAPVGPGIWEPELSVTATGDLALFFSDDGDPEHDQKISQLRTRDGVNWTDQRDTVVNDKFTVRPGMSGIRRLPDGGYVMVYEYCNYDPVHICTVYLRKSADGWNWGDVHDTGTEVVSDTGGQPLGTPTIAWAPGPNPNGRLLLAYQMLAGDNGGWAPGNGKTIMVNDNPSDLKGPWREIPSPVQISYNEGSVCRNFSPTLLPTRDARGVIEVTTDYEHYIGGPCEAWNGVGPLGGTAVTATPHATPMDTRPGR